ncbi:MAG: hypothetical protein M1823_000959 [Watsoniomyces obsoletus]|nr:MAG: hypothetical protein M1823_000959 [Watsoniomyces obsoletus]
MKLSSIPSFSILLLSATIVGVIAPPPHPSGYGVAPGDAIPPEMDIEAGYEVAMRTARLFFCPNCVTKITNPDAELIGPPGLVRRVEKELKSKPKDLPPDKRIGWCTEVLHKTLKWQNGELTKMLKKDLAKDPRRKTLSKISHEASKEIPRYQCTGDDLNFLINNPNASPLFPNGQPRYDQKGGAIRTVKPKWIIPSTEGGQVPNQDGSQGEEDSKGGSTNAYRVDNQHGEKRRVSSSSSGSNIFLAAMAGQSWNKKNPLEMRVSQGDVKKWVDGGIQNAQRTWTEYTEDMGPAVAAWIAKGGGGGVMKVPGVGNVPLKGMTP